MMNYTIIFNIWNISIRKEYSEAPWLSSDTDRVIYVDVLKFHLEKTTLSGDKQLVDSAR